MFEIFSFQMTEMNEYILQPIVFSLTNWLNVAALCNLRGS